LKSIISNASKLTVSYYCDKSYSVDRKLYRTDRVEGGEPRRESLVDTYIAVPEVLSLKLSIISILC
jgi:hypothetical protein